MHKIYLSFFVLLLCVCSFFLGNYYTNFATPPTEDLATDNSTSTQELTPDYSRPDYFYMYSYSTDCNKDNIPDQQKCMQDLAFNTSQNLDYLRQNILETNYKATIQNNIEMLNAFKHYVNGVSLIQRDYDITYCGINSIKNYSGTGSTIQFNACMYYLDNQMLQELKTANKEVIKQLMETEIQTNPNYKPVTIPICSSDYPKTEDGDKARIDALKKWTKDYYNIATDASILDFTNARRKFWIDFDCNEELQKYDDYINGKVDKKSVDIIEKVVNEKIK